MMSKIIRGLIFLTLLVVGLGLWGFGLTMRVTTQQFLDTENAFRASSANTFSGEWVDGEPNMLTRAAQDVLETDELLKVRSALVAYRKSQITIGSEDYFAYGYASSSEVDREIAKFQLLSIANTSEDIRTVVQVATLLGNLYAQDVITYIQAEDAGKAQEAYKKAVEAFTSAITADSSDKFNLEAKENLEALIRMFMGENQNGGKGKPASGSRPGASVPGRGY